MYQIQSKVAWALVGALSLLLIAALAGVVRGGPLDPPGPVGSTGKTVITSLPYNIDQSGSYVLNGNLTGVSGDDGIHVNAKNVTIDLQGFELIGVTGALSGIEIFTTNVEVRNGTIRDWPDAGIYAIYEPGTTVDSLRLPGNGWGMSLGDGARVNNCQVVGSLTYGGIYAGTGSTITNCVLRNNADVEVSAGNSSVLENCTADGAGGAGNGIQVGDDSVVRGCTAKHNGGTEILGGTRVTLENCSAFGTLTSGNGIELGWGSTIRGCTTSNNNGVGLLVDEISTIENCGANGNGGHGIQIGHGSTVSGCSTKNNGGHEILAGERVILENCVADGFNTAGNGIEVGPNSTVRGCTATRNNGHEIAAYDRSIIENSVADGWTGAADGPGDGIAVANNVIVRGCTAQNNALAGIHAYGRDNRIESNHLIGNTLGGIDVDLTVNVIVSNSATGNTPNYDIVPGNQYVPAASVIGATNPWANIEY